MHAMPTNVEIKAIVHYVISLESIVRNMTKKDPS